VRNYFTALDLIEPFLDRCEEFNSSGYVFQSDIVRHLMNGLEDGFFVAHGRTMPQFRSCGKPFNLIFQDEAAHARETALAGRIQRVARTRRSVAQASFMVRRPDARILRISASVFFILLRIASISFKHSSIAFR
jgi:hypothetical protein